MFKKGIHWKCPHCGRFLKTWSPIWDELIGHPTAMCQHCFEQYRTHMDHWSDKSKYKKFEVILDAIVKGALLAIPLELFVFIIVHALINIKFPNVSQKKTFPVSCFVTFVWIAIGMTLHVRKLIRRYP